MIAYSLLITAILFFTLGFNFRDWLDTLLDKRDETKRENATTKAEEPESVVDKHHNDNIRILS